VEPGAGIDPRAIGYAVEILRTRRLERRARTQYLALRLLTARPVGFDRLPELLQALLVRIAVLDDERSDSLRMRERQAIADGRAVVHDIERVATHAETRQQRVGDVCEAGEAVAELAAVRHIAVTEPRVVRRDDVIAIRQRRNQVAKHVRRTGKAMQQHDGRRVYRTGFSVENFYAIDARRSMMSLHCERWLREGIGEYEQRCGCQARDVHGRLLFDRFDVVTCNGLLYRLRTRNM
jgi:hypothetical protein